eukprot:scaffold18410_cov30-Tisochrysis_lutea.AAC.3
MAPGQPLVPGHEGGNAAVWGPGPEAFPASLMERPALAGVMWLVWLWWVVWVCCMLSAASLQSLVALFSVVPGRCPLALAPTWSGGSS